MEKSDYTPKICIICGRVFFHKYPTHRKNAFFPKRKKSAKTCSHKCSILYTEQKVYLARIEIKNKRRAIREAKNERS